ncbi:MAG: hypothetical protein ACRDJU_12115 [Actinomycetota bacterium]
MSEEATMTTTEEQSVDLTEAQSDDLTEGQNQGQGPIEDTAGEQTSGETAADGSALAAGLVEGDDGPQVNLDIAEQQIAEWRQEDATLLGEAPELSPSSAEAPEGLPTSPEAVQVAEMREEAEALLGGGLEGKPVATSNEADLV